MTAANAEPLRPPRWADHRPVVVAMVSASDPVNRAAKVRSGDSDSDDHRASGKASCTPGETHWSTALGMGNSPMAAAPSITVPAKNSCCIAPARLRLLSGKRMAMTRATAASAWAMASCQLCTEPNNSSVVNTAAAMARPSHFLRLRVPRPSPSGATLPVVVADCCVSSPHDPWREDSLPILVKACESANT